MTPYTDWEYAHNRLSSTLVKYNDKPAVVVGVDPDFMVEIKKHEGSYAAYSVVPLDDIDLTPPRLGYINHPTRSLYAVRNPARQWKQGFRFSQVLRWSDVFGGLSLLSTPVVNMFMGRYPKISEVVDSIANEESNSKAFSQDFCLSGLTSRGYRLLFKGQGVGYVADNRSDNFTALFDEGYEFLEEAFQESINA